MKKANAPKKPKKKVTFGPNTVYEIPGRVKNVINLTKNEIINLTKNINFINLTKNNKKKKRS